MTVSEGFGWIREAREQRADIVQTAAEERDAVFNSGGFIRLNGIVISKRISGLMV